MLLVVHVLLITLICLFDLLVAVTVKLPSDDDDDDDDDNNDGDDEDDDDDGVACSRLRDSGEKSFSKKKCEKRAGARERQGGVPVFLTTTAPFPKSRASYFRFARFNTSALYYLKALYRLREYKLPSSLRTLY